MGLPLLLYLFLTNKCRVLNGKSLVCKNRNADLPPEIGFCFCKTACGRFDEVANDPRGAKTSAGLFSVGSSESYCNCHYDADANFPIALIWFFLFYTLQKVWLYRLISWNCLFSQFKVLWRISSSEFIFSESGTTYQCKWNWGCVKVLSWILEPAEKFQQNQIVLQYE